MRLLNTETFKLSDFVRSTPAYAILSHTWAPDGELLFADLQGDPTVKTGWAKVRAACDLARKLDFNWIWIDTCCIDKSSSAELSEAINSMFKWYQKAGVCFAYLSDVPWYEPGTAETHITALGQSKWFTRGWTLQELLAPKRLDFYSSDWERIAARRDLGGVLETITGIDSAYIVEEKSLVLASVAERMCWASKRETTRVEDIAYCLLGIFGVNMPLIYGEGLKAFSRLQQLILREIDDQSIFAWGRPASNSNWASDMRINPLLADHPILFSYSGDIVPFWTTDIENRLHIEHDGITVGMPLCRPLQPTHITFRRSTFLAPLQCCRKSDPFNCIALKLTSSAPRNPQNGRLLLPIPCYRMSANVFSATKRIWVASQICSTFVYFRTQNQFQKMSTTSFRWETSIFCIIRTLPSQFKATIFSTYTTADTPFIGYPQTTPRIPLNGRHQLSYDAYGLGMPAVVFLEGPMPFRLALVLQSQWSSLRRAGLEDSDPLFEDPNWVISRIIKVTDGFGVEDVLKRVTHESQQMGIDEVEYLDSWQAPGNDMSIVFQTSQFEAFTKFRTKIFQDDAFGPKVFTVDVEDPHGPNDCAEATLGGQFACVRSPTSSNQRMSISSLQEV